MRKFLPFLQWCLPLFVITSSLQASTLELKPVMEGVFAGPYLEIIRDSTGDLSLEQILEGRHEEPFKVDRSIPTFGYFDRNLYWARLSLHNPTDESMKLFLVSVYAPLDYLTVYSPNIDGSYQSLTLGDQVPFVDRPISYRYPIFPVTVAPGTHDYYIKVKTSSSTQFPLAVWSETAFLSHEPLESSFLGLLFGALTVMLFYNFFVFMKFRSRAYGTYVIYIASYLIFAAIYQGIFQQLFVPEAASSWMVNLGIMLMIDMISLSAYSFSIEFLELKKRSRRLYMLCQIMRVLTVLNMVNTLTFQIGAQQFTLMGSMLLAVTLLGSGIRMSLIYRPARYYTVAWTFVLLGNVTVLLAGNGVIPLNTMTSWAQFIGAVIELVLLSFALGDRMALINEEREEALRAQHKLQDELLSSEREKAAAKQQLLAEREENIRVLDRKVYERTRDIRTIMKSINQGIFTIANNDHRLVIESEYSHYLTELIGQTKLQGKEPLELVFANDAVSSDHRSQIRETLLASLGEDLLNYEANCDLLVREAQLKRPDGSLATMEIDWIPVLNEEETIDKVLVTMRDVSQIRKLREQADMQSFELILTGELTSKQGKKFPKLRNGLYLAMETMSDQLQKLRHDEHLPNQVRQEILRFLHTAKGDSRVYGFPTLSQRIHDVETKMVEAKTANPQEVAELLQPINDILGQYNYVWVERLGFQDESEERISIAVPMVRRIFQFMESAKLNTSIDPQDFDEIQRQLSLSIGTDLETMISDQVDDIKRLAKELEKSTPEIVFQGRSPVIPKAFHDKLGQVFGHLLRNSLDHGIETKVERIKAGKPANGKITFVQNFENSRFKVILSDDGQGLDIKKVYDIAQTKSLVSTPMAEMSKEDIAEMVFLPEFSTRDVASIISGRGVGLDAVRALMASIDGTVKIKVGSSKGLHHYAISFELDFPIPDVNKDLKTQDAA